MPFQTLLILDHYCRDFARAPRLIPPKSGNGLGMAAKEQAHGKLSQKPIRFSI